MCYECEIWSVLGCKSAIADVERVQIEILHILKPLLGLQTCTTTVHVLAAFGRYPLKIAWQAQPAEYLSRLELLEPLDDNRTLKHAIFANRRLPKHRSCTFQLEVQLHDVYIRYITVNESTTDSHSLRCFSIQTTQKTHKVQLSSSISIKAATYRDVKVGYGCKPYIQQSNNRHLGQIVAQFRTKSHWLNIDPERHKKSDRSGRLILMRMLLIP